MGHAKLTSEDHSAEWPSFLRNVTTKKTQTTDESPIVVQMAEKDAEKQLAELVKAHQITRVIDNYDEQYAELQLSLDAHLYRANESVQRNSIKQKLKEHYGAHKSWQLGAWVYYPWNQQLVHVLNETDFVNLRTIRNRDLIDAKEQKKIYEFGAACVGMSVGSASALSLVLSGMSKQIKVADGAVISGSNLNRVLTGVGNIGLEKSLVVARQLYEMNPYIQVHRHGKVTSATVAALFDKPWPIKAVVDEIDDLEIKIRLRQAAKDRKLPVVMATELGDTVMLDVERFDLEPSRPLFHGLVPEVESILDKKAMTHREWQKHAATIIDAKNMPVILQKSLLKIGSSIVTHPQLGSTVMMTGGVTTYALKRIALGQSMPSGRTSISLDKLLVPDFHKLSSRLHHRRHTRMMKKSLGSM